MPKLAIFLCTLLVTLAVDASYESDVLAFTKASVDELIASTIQAIKQEFDHIKSKAKKDVAKFGTDAQSGLNEAMQRITSTLEQAQVQIEKFTSKDDSPEITDCNQLLNRAMLTGYIAIVTMEECLNEKLDTGNRYVQNINTLSNNVIANLTAIREEARHCRDNVNDNVDDFNKAVPALNCIDTTGSKVTWVKTEGMPSLIIELTKIGNSLATLQSSLADCSTINEFDTFYRESSTVVERTKQCIYRKRGAKIVPTQ